MKASSEDKVLLGLIASRAALAASGLTKGNLSDGEGLCARGAVMKAHNLGYDWKGLLVTEVYDHYNYKIPHLFWEIDDELREAAPPQENEYHPLEPHVGFNNRKDTTLEDVLSMFDWAIERRKRKIQSWALAEAA